MLKKHYCNYMKWYNTSLGKQPQNVRRMTWLALRSSTLNRQRISLCLLMPWLQWMLIKSWMPVRVDSCKIRILTCMATTHFWYHVLVNMASNLTNLLVLKKSLKKARKFVAYGFGYEIVNGLKEDVASAAKTGFKIEAIIKHVITKITAGHGSNAMARLMLMQPALDKPVSLPLKSISELKASDVMTQISKIIQAKSEFDLSLRFTVHIVIVQLHFGGRNLRICSSWEQFKKDFRCIIQNAKHRSWFQSW